MYRFWGQRVIRRSEKKARWLAMRRSGRGKMVSEGYVEFLLSLPGARWVYFDGFINPVMEIRDK